jgi:uncharacterized protein YuzB (UPF0349 family)
MKAMIEVCDICRSNHIQHKDEYYGHINKARNIKVTNYQEYDQCTNCGNVLRGSTKVIEKEELR